MREVLLDPAGRVDEIDGVIVVLLDAGGHGEDIGIKHDVLGREGGLLREDLVGARADFRAALEVVRLAFFIEGHDDGGRAVTPDEAGLPEEFLFADLEADGIDHALALHAAEAGLEDGPLRAIDHDGDARRCRARWR